MSWFLVCFSHQKWEAQKHINSGSSSIAMGQQMFVKICVVKVPYAQPVHFLKCFSHIFGLGWIAGHICVLFHLDMGWVYMDPKSRIVLNQCVTRLDCCMLCKISCTLRVCSTLPPPPIKLWAARHRWCEHAAFVLSPLNRHSGREYAEQRRNILIQMGTHC